MQPGDTVDYNGAATRAGSDEPLQIEGRFRAVEERREGDTLQWLVEDERVGSVIPAEDRESHRYLIPASSRLDEQPAPPADAPAGDEPAAGSA